MQTRWLCYLFTAGCWGFSVTTAGAQESAPSPQRLPESTSLPVATQPVSAAQPNQIFLVAEPPAPPAARRYHYHDSFYLRVNAGYLLPWGDFKARESGFHPTYAGNGLALDLLIGGSPSPGVAIGGAFFGGYALTSDSGPDPFDPDIQMMVIGPFIDGFPDPAGGWHFGGSVGLASLLAHDRRIAESLLGVGGTGWLGYDAWVAPDWAVGGLLRLGVTVASSTGGVETASRSAYLALYFSALFH